MNWYLGLLQNDLGSLHNSRRDEKCTVIWDNIATKSNSSLQTPPYRIKLYEYKTEKMWGAGKGT